jgi:hypothetical protein
MAAVDEEDGGADDDATRESYSAAEYADISTPPPSDPVDDDLDIMPH